VVFFLLSRPLFFAGPKLRLEAGRSSKMAQIAVCGNINHLCFIMIMNASSSPALRQSTQAE
jgi:hypothetical protein